MPQESMFQIGKRLIGITISVQEELTSWGGEWRVATRQHYEDGTAYTVHERLWRGYEVDLITTYAEDVAAAFMWGEAGDVAKAAVSVDKVARAHARRHDRVGG